MKSFKDLKEEILLEGGQMYPADEMTMKELKIACYAANNILDRLEDGAMIQRWQISAIVKASEELASVYTSMSADMGDYEDDYEDEVVGYEYPYMYGEEVELDEDIKGAFKNFKKHAANLGDKFVQGALHGATFGMMGHDTHDPLTGDAYNKVKPFSNRSKKKKIKEELDFKVSVEGLPDMYVKANSPSEVKANLRKIVRKPDMVRSVDRVTQSMIKKIFRDKAAGKEDLDEKLKASDDMGDWVKDFQDSDAPQFKGKSLKKRQQMAVAAKLSAERNEDVDLDEKYKDPWAAPRKGSSAWHAAQQRKKAERDPEEVKRVNAIGNKNHMVGTAKVTHNEEVDIDEAVEFRHDRYMRSHGKKASGGSGHWMFTHKNMGDVDYNNEKEVHMANGKFADAKKSAQQWAKKHGHDTVYVMEEVEQLDELSPKTLKSYMKKSADQLDKVERDWKDKSVSDKKVANRLTGFDRASKRLKSEEVEQIDEISKKTLGSYIRKASDQVSDRGFEAGYKAGKGKSDDVVMKPYKRGEKRLAGIAKAVGKLTSEEAAKKSIDDKTKQDFKRIDDQIRKMHSAAVKHVSDYNAKKGSKPVKESAEIHESEDFRKSVIGDAIKRYADDAGNAKEIRGVSVNKIIDAFASKKAYGNKSIDELESELGLPVGIVIKLIAKVKENLKLNYNVKASSGPTQAQRIGSYLKQKHIGPIKR
jgi:hypothetical protein